MAQGRSTIIISMIKWIRTRRLSIKKSLSPNLEGIFGVEVLGLAAFRLEWSYIAFEAWCLEFGV